MHDRPHVYDRKGDPSLFFSSCFFGHPNGRYYQLPSPRHSRTFFFPVVRLLWLSLQVSKDKMLWIKDGDAFIPGGFEQGFVSAADDSCSTRDRAGKKLVIIWVGTDLLLQRGCVHNSRSESQQL